MNILEFLSKKLRNESIFIYILLILFLLLSSLIFSQVEEWVTRYNGSGNGDDGATGIAIDNSGNIYVTGGSIGSGTGSDYATIKYNNSGIDQWVTRYNGSGNGDDGATGIAIDNSGNVYVTGGSTGSGTYHDYATIKYNNSGVEQWVARYNGPGNDYDSADAIAIDSSGNVYVSGGSYGSGTESDYATIKYNNAGVEEWVARYNGPGNDNDEALAIALDSLGNVYVTGYSIGLETDNDYATIKYNSAGVEQWVVRYNGPGNYRDYAYAMVIDSSDNICITGFSDGDPGTSSYNYDYATIKYNSSGIQQWIAIYNSPVNSNDKAYAITIDSSENVYVTGFYVTIKYNIDGVEQWVSNRRSTRDIVIDNSGNVYVTGESFDSDTLLDYAIIKYNCEGVEQGIALYNGPGNDWDRARAITIDNSENIYITGESYGSGTDYDYATIKYSQKIIKIVTPNGGDTWQTGSTREITWLSGCYVGSSVRITLYKNNVYLIAITSDTENDGSYSWYIPTYFELGSDYKIRITSNSDNSIYDYSDNNFTINKWITVTSPNGDEIWTKGSNQTITWASENGVSSWIRITLYKNNIYQFPITSITFNDGSRNWTIPGSIIPGNDYKVKITSDSDSSMYDFSDKNFSIIESVTVTSPNGGEILTIGAANNITWTSSVDLGPSLRITLYKEGAYYSTITNDTANSGSYSWTIPPNVEPGDDYKIKITSNSNNASYDFSDDNFTIARGITVTLPNGGDNWQLGTIWSIMWTSSDDVGSSIRITLYKGGTYLTTITGNTPNDGLYTWSIPTYLEAGDDYKIRITSNTNEAFFDFSDNNFTITRGITVTSPNGMENWELGSTHNINWTSLGNLGPSLRITLYKEGAHYLTITGDTPDDGSYSWTIPPTLATGTDYKVRITSNTNGMYYDFSDNDFTIFIFE